jgi:dipeptidyl aminopeptidase/acylaminoacyl peptidase
MGGGVTSKAIVLDDRIGAAVLYGPVPADDRVYFNRWRPRRNPGTLTDPLEIAYQRALSDRRFLQRTSPITYFSLVTAPVQIHVGEVDDVTPPRWARAIRDELLEQGKTVEYYQYPGQGHAFHGDSWTLFMERVTQFFDQHLK